MRRIFNTMLVTALAGTAALLSQPADAEWPNRPIELVMPTGPGSGAANEARVFAAELQKPGFLGVPVKLVFKKGGGGNNAAIYAGKRPADGNTLFFIGGSFSGLFNMPHYTYKADHFDIIVQFLTNFYAIGVKGDSDFKTIEDYVAYAKANPNKLSMGSNKIASLQHRVQTAFLAAAGANVRFVPYNGTGAVVKDVVGGHLPSGVAQPGLWLPQVKAGKARVLLILDNERLNHPMFKDIPTSAEAGYKFDIPVQFHAFMARKGVPKDRIKIIQQAFKKALATEGMKTFLENQPHARKAYRDDVEQMNKDFKDSMVKTRKFMVKHKILKN